MPQGPSLVRGAYDATAGITNITAATVVRTTGGAKLVAISVISAGTVGAVFDATATGSPATVGKQIAAIPATVGVFPINWPCATGLTIVPGASQVLAVTLA